MKRAREPNGVAMLKTQYCRELGYDCPRYMGISICINDPIALPQPPDTNWSDCFVVDRTSVVGLVNSNAPDIRVTRLRGRRRR